MISLRTHKPKSTHPFLSLNISPVGNVFGFIKSNMLNMNYECPPQSHAECTTQQVQQTMQEDHPKCQVEMVERCPTDESEKRYVEM